MRRSLWLLVAVVTALAGCQGQGNPFLRTTIPPPGTGAAAPADPYYGGSGPPPIGAPQTVPPGAAAPPQIVVPPPDKRYSAPGGYNFPQGSVTPRKAVDPHPNDYRTGASSIARAARPRPTHETAKESAIAANDGSDESDEVAAASHESPAEDGEIASGTEPVAEVASRATAEPTQVAVRGSKVGIPEFQDENSVGSAAARPAGTVMRIVNTTDGAVAAEQPAEPAKFVAEQTPDRPFRALGAGGGVAIASADTAAAANSTTTTSTDKPRRYFDRARPVSYTTPAHANNSQPATASTGVSTGPDGAPSYSHHTGYSWLRGKLEYSTASRRWKLRYIPIDGQTDSFGGSVVLPSTPQMESFQPGQLVTVHGNVGNGAAESGGFSPTYELKQIVPQG